MPGQKDGKTEGWTDPILQDPSGYQRGSNKYINKQIYIYINKYKYVYNTYYIYIKTYR